MIKVSNLSFSYTGTSVFDGVNFTVGQKTKVGLVGPNGAGKSTLFRLLTGRQEPSWGDVEVKGTLGYVPQEVKQDALLKSATSVREYADPDSLYLDYELLEFFSSLELENITLEDIPSLMSGGQKTKLALARALLLKPEVLLLDEPTNFMDIAGKKWVMEFLSDYPNSLIIVSHDIELMDSAIDKVFELNTHTKQIDEYKGNYTTYKKLKAEKEALLKRQILVKQKHIEGMEAGLKKHTQSVRQRIQMQKRIEREKANLPTLPPDVRSIKLQLPTPARGPEIPVSVSHVVKSYGNKTVIKDFSFYIERGQRVGFIGPNGVGKSTLIKMVTKQIEPDSGEVRLGEGIKIGYYTQEFEDINLDKTLFDVIQEESKLPESRVRAFLGKFMFARDKAFQQISSLSGGEKTRLSIARLLLKDYNFLILDEPTTYLDVLSQRIILEALKEYQGAMIIVSHTEQFIEELNLNKVLFLPEGKFDFWRPEYLSKISEVE